MLVLTGLRFGDLELYCFLTLLDSESITLNSKSHLCFFIVQFYSYHVLRL